MNWILILILILVFLLVLGLIIFFIVKNDKKNTNLGPTGPPTGPTNPNDPAGPVGPPTLTPLPGPTNPPLLIPLPSPPIRLNPPTLNPLPSPPLRTIGNSLIQQIYNAISPNDNGAAAYNLLIQNQNNLTNLTPFEYGIAAGVGYYLGVYLNNNSPNSTMIAIQLQLQTYYSGNDLDEAWCGVRYTFEKAGYLSQVPTWSNLLICKN